MVPWKLEPTDVIRFKAVVTGNKTSVSEGNLLLDEVLRPRGCVQLGTYYSDSMVNSVMTARRRSLGEEDVKLHTLQLALVSQCTRSFITYT